MTGALLQSESGTGTVAWHSAESPRTIRVALAGCGVVGGALARLLHDTAPAIASRHGVRFELRRVLVRDVTRIRDVPVSPGLFTDDHLVFDDEDVDVVVEAIGGRERAGDIARATLGRGRNFVTANKELIAAGAPELAALARSNDAALDFGAAVGGSAPVISLLRDLLGTTTPRSVRGILNGTSNYVLTRMETGMSFNEALDAARREGLAEADCSRDMDGRDAAAKLAIIGWLAYGIAPATLHVDCLPLTHRIRDLVQFAARVGGRVRVISECLQVDGRAVAASVEPVVVPDDSAFARTLLEDNRVEVDLGWSAPLAVSGPGAGGLPTATALLSDLLHSSAPPLRDRQPGNRFARMADPEIHSWLITERADQQPVLIRAVRSDVLKRLETLRKRGCDFAIARVELPGLREEAT